MNIVKKGLKLVNSSLGMSAVEILKFLHFRLYILNDSTFSKAINKVFSMEHAGSSVMLLTYIQKVPGSNLS
jgi:hypothetical protein